MSTEHRIGREGLDVALGCYVSTEPPITLRDFFAGCAMVAQLLLRKDGDVWLCEDAFILADSMLAARDAD